jgi:hypothetical protein
VTREVGIGAGSAHRLRSQAEVIGLGSLPYAGEALLQVFSLYRFAKAVGHEVRSVQRRASEVNVEASGESLATSERCSASSGDFCSRFSSTRGFFRKAYADAAQYLDALDAHT